MTRPAGSLRVLAITPTFFPQMGGLEQVVFELAIRVREFGIDMEVAHVAAGNRAVTETFQGITVHRVPLYGNRLVGWAPSLARLAAGYDLLHVHDPQLMAITANVRLGCGAIPAVLSTHGGFWHTSRGYRVKRLYEATLLRGSIRHYRRVLATSIGDYEYYKRYVDRVDLCSNGVDVKGYGIARTRPPALDRWIYWGRLSRNKRLDVIIDYAAAMRARGHSIQLLICGRDFDGLLPGLRAQVERLGLHDEVRFEPFLDQAALLSELERCSVFITASEYEGFGLTVVEAMAAGLVVVCRNMVPLNSFFIHGKSGWTLNFDSTEGDLQSLAELLSTPAPAALAMSIAAREAALGHDWAVAVPRFVRHYREVLAEEPSRGMRGRTQHRAG